MKRIQIAPPHMGEHDILFMGDAKLSEREIVGELCQQAHLARARVAWLTADAFERHRHRPIAWHFVRADVALHPTFEGTSCFVTRWLVR